MKVKSYRTEKHRKKHEGSLWQGMDEAIYEKKGERGKMSRPRYYWYGSVKKIIMQYPSIKDDKSNQSKIYVNAIEDALEEVKQLKDGEERIYAIETILFRKTRTIEGVAIDKYYHWRTVQNWITDFVKLVGKKAGF